MLKTFLYVSASAPLINLYRFACFQDLTQYPVMPWVVADYASTSLDLDDAATFRCACFWFFWSLLVYSSIK